MRLVIRSIGLSEIVTNRNCRSLNLIGPIWLFLVNAERKLHGKDTKVPITAVGTSVRDAGVRYIMRLIYRLRDDSLQHLFDG